MASILWREGGLEAYSGTSGGHKAYGWKHTDKLSPDWARAVIANYGHRRCYYENEPKRKSSYESAGRPFVWEPEDDQDLPNGMTLYLTSKGLTSVSGPDILHFHLGPLFELIDNPQYTIKAFGQTIPAGTVAAIIVQYQMRSLCGQVLSTQTKVSRGAANVFKAAAGAAKRGLLPNDCYETIYNWLMYSFLPTYEKQGHDFEYKNYTKGIYKFQYYNGLYWLIPSLYDMIKITPDGPLKDRLNKMMDLWCGWLVQTFEFHGSLKVYDVQVDPNFKDLPEAPLDIKDYIVSITTSIETYEKWGYRAGDIASKRLEHVDLGAYIKDIGVKYSGDLQWIVGADDAT